MSSQAAHRSKLVVLSPSEAASRMGTNAHGLGVLIRKYRYEFTEIAPGGKPGDRGRNRWGVTEAQLATIIAKQARGYQPPDEPKPGAPPFSPASPDGVSRLHRGRRARL
jgi:hypothetical protein